MKCLVLVVAALVHYTMAGPNDLSVSHASNSFASQLYQELAKKPGNVLVCPVSVHIALALVHQGAVGNTASELAKTLRLSGSNDDIKNSYKTLLTGLQDDVLKIATKLYPAVSFKPKSDYVSVAQQYFLSDVQALDYGKAVDAANIINNFVENKTNNKINDIIKPDSITDLTRLIIVNAVHFKAAWAKTFPPAFTDNFKVTPTESVKTEFLGQTDYFPFKEDSTLGAKVLKMDYEREAYSMVLVLPNKDDGLAELEAKLAGVSMDSLLSGLHEVRVEVTIPKFKIEQEMQLKDVLVKMGITSMFDSRANLSNIADGESLYVTSVIQKTFIDVNEKGTEAAAATGVVTPLSGGSEERTFLARKPFHFYLIHNIPPLVVLFEGRLVKPQEKEKNPQSESKYTPTDKQGGNSNFNAGVEGDLNRISSSQQGFVSNNQGNSFNTANRDSSNIFNPPKQVLSQRPGQNNQPNIGYEQNTVVPNTQQNYGQNRPINNVNQNNPIPQPPTSNYGGISQLRPNQRPNNQPGQLNSEQYVQTPPRQQQFAPYPPQGPQPTNQFQYDNTYNQRNYRPQAQSYA